METRRDVVIGTCLALSGVAVSRSMAADFWKTPDGYVPPKKSQGLLKNIRFDQAKRIGDKYAQRFVRWDASPGSGKDPNSFKALLEIPNGAHRPVLYWDAKMAVDADGASPKVRKQSSGASKDTSYHFAGGTGLNAEVVPYFVVPTFDDPEKKAPGKPWEGSGERFVDDFGLRHGNLGVVIFESKIAGAILADEGPAMKIGEASIRSTNSSGVPRFLGKGTLQTRSSSMQAKTRGYYTSSFEIPFSISNSLDQQSRPRWRKKSRRKP